MDQVIREQKKEIERQENERTRTLKSKEQKEQSWALNELFCEFMNKKCNKWAELQARREQEQEWILRHDKAGIKRRKAKLEELKKSVRKGMEKYHPVE